MAKTAKKDNALTPEEKLESMLVPDIEQPFSIPDNWRWVFLSSISSIISKGTTPQGGRNAYTDTGVNYLRVENICDDGTISHENIMHISNEMHKGFLKRSILQENDLLVSIAGTLGKTGLVRKCDLPLNTNQAVCFVRLVSELTLYKYIKLSLDNPLIQKMLLSQTKVTSIPNLTLEIIGNCPIPLAPYSEQQRIVDRIESLFAKLDEAREKAQAVVDGFEDRKAAILHKAFSGELTAEWRKAKGILSSSWCKKRFDEVAEVKSNLVDPADYQDFPHIAPDNIEKKTGRLLEYHTIAEDGMKSGKHRFYAGQILYSKIRPNLSKVIVVDFDGLCSADMYPIEPKDGINTKYLWYYMLSEEFLIQASTAGSRSVLPKINQKELSKLTVMVTDPLEQERIVSILDQLFEKELQAKEAAEQVIDQIDIMKKSILSRAFRGELGTNDPKDESAVELLKKVLDIEPVPQPRKKSISIPKEIAEKLKTELERKIIKLFIQKETDTLTIKELINVSSKTFEILETLEELEERQIIQKSKNNDIVYTLKR